MPPLALCEKSVKNEVSPLLTLELAVLPNTVLAFKPPDVMIPCSKSAKLFSRFLRKYNHPPPSKAKAAPSGASKPASKLSNILVKKPGSTTGVGAAITGLTSSGFKASGFMDSGLIASTGFAGTGGAAITAADFSVSTDLSATFVSA